MKVRNCSERTQLACVLALVCAAMVGCAVNRPTLTPEKLTELRQKYLDAARADTRAANAKILRRMEAEHDAADGKVPTYDVLILSGGGDYGAFGAGFLKGWGTVEDPELRRPKFDMVTGVSTGALIAPLAFLGDDQSYDRLVHMYSTPKVDWFTMRGLLYFLPGNESFMDCKGLQRDLEKVLDAEAICRIAAESRENRVLAVNTTNLDVGAMHPFEVSVEAERAAESGDRSRLISILMASAAIPAVFPPVIIDGALYVDGGTTTNILYGLNWLSPKAPPQQWKLAHPDQPVPRIRFWVIVNNQLGAGPQVVQPTWLSITRASLATTIRASTTTSLRHLYVQTSEMGKSGIEAEFRYVSIPFEWMAPNNRPFDAEVMKSLAELGMKMGADPGSWRRDFAD